MVTNSCPAPGSSSFSPLAALAIAALLAFVLTRPSSRSSQRKSESAKQGLEQSKLVDTSPLETARSLSNVPSTAEERKLSDEAARIADNEVDLAFAMALEQAQQHTETDKNAAAEIKDLKARIQMLEAHLQQVQAQAARLTKQAARTCRQR